MCWLKQGHLFSICYQLCNSWLEFIQFLRNAIRNKANVSISHEQSYVPLTFLFWWMLWCSVLKIIATQASKNFTSNFNDIIFIDVWNENGFRGRVQLILWHILLMLDDFSFLPNWMKKSHPILWIERCFNDSELCRMQRWLLPCIWRIFFCVFHTLKVFCILSLQHLYWRCRNPCDTKYFCSYNPFL